MTGTGDPLEVCTGVPVSAQKKSFVKVPTFFSCDHAKKYKIMLKSVEPHGKSIGSLKPE
jgi:hypothetical protein